ncbi:GNAT family N-acetyltransferase [Clostridiaceae bacterium M8S5]|nr:GNAT family N-acetyltransferase [Clostridiaceae bacterium M8S5]
MEVIYLQENRAQEFARYCQKYGRDHDESFLPDSKFKPNKDNPTYVLLDDNDKIVGAASLIMDEKYRAKEKARFSIFHTILNDKHYYKLMLDSILEHVEGINYIYLFVPENKNVSRDILTSIGFNIERFSYYMERGNINVERTALEDSYELKSLRKGQDEKTWCDIYNECFKESQGHVDISIDSINKMLSEAEHIENGMKLLWYEDKAIGSIRISKDQDGDKSFAFISDVAIIKGYRRRGLGRYLIKEGIEFGKANGLGNSSLVVNAINENAALLYCSEGFNKKLAIVCYGMKI